MGLLKFKQLKFVTENLSIRRFFILLHVRIESMEFFALKLTFALIDELEPELQIIKTSNFLGYTRTMNVKLF